MSTVVMNHCWRLSLQPSMKAVLISLADQANDEGVCWPSLRTLTIRTCLAESTIREALRGLEAAGILETEERSGTSNRYTITVEGVGQPMEPVYPQARKARQTPPATGALPHRQPAPTPPATGPHPTGSRPLTINEPSLNRSLGASELTRACILLREAGLLTANPSHPNLIAAVSEGVTAEDLANTCEEFPGKAFGYIIAVARRRKADGTSAIHQGETSHEATHPLQRRRGESLVDHAERINRLHDEREAADTPA